jgi:hypothetical protein
MDKKDGEKKAAAMIMSPPAKVQRLPGASAGALKRGSIQGQLFGDRPPPGADAFSSPPPKQQALSDVIMDTPDSKYLTFSDNEVSNEGIFM